MNVQTNRKIRVNRPFLYEGKRREIGEELVVTAQLASELSSANKAESADSAPSAAHLAALGDVVKAPARKAA
jgi:hypothetical protein